MTDRLVLAAIAALTSLSSTLARADDPPAPPPPQHEWIGKGQFGFLDSKGNSDAESINGSIDMEPPPQARIAACRSATVVVGRLAA